MISPPSRGARRAGLTALELLIVLVLLLVVVLLFLPMWLRERSHARLAACRGNLGQLAAAAQTYAGVHGCFPGGSYPSAGRAHNFSGFARLAPYLGRAALYNHLNFDLTHHAAANLTAGSYALGMLTCPEDPEAARAAPAHESASPTVRIGSLRASGRSASPAMPAAPGRGTSIPTPVPRDMPPSRPASTASSSATAPSARTT